MLKHDPDERWNHAGLAVIPAKEAFRLFTGGYRTSSPLEPQRCDYCGIGYYEMVADGEQHSSHVRNFGISPTGMDILKIFGCKECGHIQMFRRDLAKSKTMWPPGQSR